MKKTTISIIIGIIFVVAPSITQASTVDDLRAQIASLLRVVTQLQQQLAKTINTETQNITSRPVKQTIEDITCDKISLLTHNMWPGITDKQVNGNVSILQSLLVRGYNVDITGYYDYKTEFAIRKLQETKNIISYGTPNTTGYGAFGPKTRAKIMRSCDKTFRFMNVHTGMTYGTHMPIETVSPGDSILVDWDISESLKPKTYNINFSLVGLNNESASLHHESTVKFNNKLTASLTIPKKCSKNLKPSPCSTNIKNGKFRVRITGYVCADTTVDVMQCKFKDKIDIWSGYSDWFNINLNSIETNNVPEIGSFTVYPENILAGQNAKLSWSTTGVKSCNIIELTGNNYLNVGSNSVMYINPTAINSDGYAKFQLQCKSNNDKSVHKDVKLYVRKNNESHEDTTQKKRLIELRDSVLKSVLKLEKLGIEPVEHQFSYGFSSNGDALTAEIVRLMTIEIKLQKQLDEYKNSHKFKFVDGIRLNVSMINGGGHYNTNTVNYHNGQVHIRGVAINQEQMYGYTIMLYKNGSFLRQINNSDVTLKKYVDTMPKRQRLVFSMNIYDIINNGEFNLSTDVFTLQLAIQLSTGEKVKASASPGFIISTNGCSNVNQPVCGTVNYTSCSNAIVPQICRLQQQLLETQGGRTYKSMCHLKDAGATFKHTGVCNRN